MKLSKKTPAVRGPFVSIGSRGVVVNDLASLPASLKIGKQPILPKERGSDEAIWIASASWITSRKADAPEFTIGTGKDAQPAFTILPVEQAIRTKKVSVHKGLVFKQGKHTFRADVLAEPGWSPKTGKQPQYLGVIRANGYRHNRIESRLVREADGSESRNKAYVAKLVK